MCGLARRIQMVRKGENTCDVAGCKYAVGVLASYSGGAHALSQRLTNDMDHNWSILSQQLYALIIGNER